MLITDLDKHLNRGPVPKDYPSNRRTFYSPIDDVHGALVDVLASATRSVVLSMYGYDDDELAGLIAKHLDNPAMYVQVSLDRSQAGGVHERLILDKFKAEMDSNNVAIGSSEKGAIAHRKMLIIDGVWTVTGSTNWSASGEQKQDNELTVTCDANVAAEARHILDLSHSAMLTQMQARAARGGTTTYHAQGKP